VLADEQCVLVLGMILEVSVEPIAPLGAHDVQEPRELVVAELLRDFFRARRTGRATSGEVNDEPT
jgi:hypothetical protein